MRDLVDWEARGSYPEYGSISGDLTLVAEDDRLHYIPNCGMEG